MGTDNGKNSSGIMNDLIGEGYSYHVWQAVWLIEQITKKSFPQRNDYLLDQSGIRFRPYDKYEYPPTDIRLIKCEENEITFILNFLGLYGINSPLPRCYHDQVAIQTRSEGEGNVPLQNFYDMFNNRFYWLYYQSWKKYRFHLFLNEGYNPVKERLFSFTGAQQLSVIPDFTLLKFAGIFTQRARSRAGLQILLAYLFPLFAINIKEFVPRWIELTDAPAVGDEEFSLGMNSYIGRTSLEYMGRICIEVANMKFTDYIEFLPGSYNAKRLAEIMNLYVNDGLEFDVKFTIDSEAMPLSSLGDEGIRLGISSWLGPPEEKQLNIYFTHEEFIN